jgi:ABC-type amino acid transport substrate-binding protein
MPHKKLLFVLFILLVITSQLSGNKAKKVIVGTKPAEPFVIQDANNNWKGISFELWEQMANDLDLDYEVREYDLEGLLEAVEKSEIDIAVSPLTITSERENNFDFTHSYFTTGLSIAVSNEGGGALSVAKRFFSIRFLEVVSIIILILFAVGLIVWLFERKKNSNEFGGSLAHGLGSSFWWAAVTVTTVGYGDKSPKTLGGRIIALLWMFAGLIMISGFTAAIASALTVGELDVGINSVGDLYKVRVVTVKGSSSEEYLIDNGINFITSDNVDGAIDLILKEKVDAFVYDAPIVKYHIKDLNLANEVKVLPLVLDPINYAFALPHDSPLRESLNRTLLENISSSNWKETISNYIGR